MRWITTAIIAAIITLFPIKAQAYGWMVEGLVNEAACNTAEAMHYDLIQIGFFPFFTGLTAQGFQITVYTSAASYAPPTQTAQFIVLLESEGVSCLATQGEEMIINIRRDM